MEVQMKEFRASWTAIEYAARVSRRSPMAETQKEQVRFLKGLKKLKHLEPFRFAHRIVSTGEIHDVQNIPGLHVTQRAGSLLVSLNEQHIIEHPQLKKLRMHTHIDGASLHGKEADLHSAYIFEFDGIDRATADQIRTYGQAGHVMESQRTVKPNDGLIVPASIQADVKAMQAWHDYGIALKLAMLRLEERDIPREDIRAVYPMATQTRIISIMRLGNWKQFIRERLHSSAQTGIQEAAWEVQTALKEKGVL